MDKSQAYYNLNDLLVSYKFVNVCPTPKLNHIIMKNFSVSIYTIWETYIKSFMYDTYVQNEELIYTEKFVANYFKKLFNKNYTKNIFIENLNFPNINRDIMFHSNNINWYEFQAFVELLGFDINKLKSNLKANSGLIQLLGLLQTKGIMPYYNKQNVERDLDIKKIIGYIQMIVENRNSISHSYRQYLDEIIDVHKAKYIVNFIKIIIKEIEIFIKQELIKLLYDNGKFKDYTVVHNIIKSCNGGMDQSAIVEINWPTNEPVPCKLYLRDDSNNLREIEIVNITYKRATLKSIHAGIALAIEIRCDMRIKKRKNYVICGRMTPQEKMKIVNPYYNVVDFY